ncbi:transglutaminaseTgpA domain-containing protein [Actinosynnema sp. NPDC020468]|uniref:DUF3488 and transglutaminase-like domain-containing protein n=1 Tax=Actinosynnema sp. NPDC020468 TaxID=3154488 RepID=UPI0033C13750
MSARRGWAAVVVAAAAAYLGVGWQGWVPAAVFVGVVVVAFGCAPLVRWRRVSRGLVLFGLVVLAALGAYLAARRGAESPVSVVLDLVPRLLTAARPAPATPGLLAPGALLVFAVALAVAVSVDGRGRALVAPAGGMVVLYTAAALLTGGRADPHGLVALGFVALVAVGWVVVDRVERGGRVLLGLPAALGAVVALVASVLPTSGAFEPRDLVRPPVVDLGVSSPLPQLASWAGLGSAELFRVQGSDQAVRLVALSDYSGAAWRAASLYGPLGAVAEPDLPAGARTREVEASITIGELRGNWLPVVGRPTGVTLADAVVDPDSGSLVLPGDVTGGLSYRVRGVLDTPDDGDLVTASVPGARRYTAVPGLPYSLGEYARQATRTAKTPYERAVALEQVVRTGRTPDAQAPVGSSYARLERFLFGNPGEPGANAGTAEQFASAFAVLGRAVGLPTRVVVGFQPRDGVVRGGDATAWPEVYFTGWGWVLFDPVAGTSSGASSAAAKREVLDRLASITATPTTTNLSAPPPYVPPPATSHPEAAPASAQRWLGLLAIPATPLVLLSLLALLRLGRRARLRRAGPRGAWAYVLDALLLAGRTPKPDRTAPDIARELNLPPAVRLAHLADAAAFAPSHQDTAASARAARITGTTPPPDDEAWRLARETRAALKRRIPWHRKLFWPVDPRPLRRRR